MSLRILVKGRVQTVGFRFFCKRLAGRLDIKGTAENLQNGNLEIFVKENQKNTDKFIEKIRKGPPLARVDEVEVAKSDQELDDIVGFRIIR